VKLAPGVVLRRWFQRQISSRSELAAVVVLPPLELRLSPTFAALSVSAKHAESVDHRNVFLCRRPPVARVFPSALLWTRLIYISLSDD